MRLLPWQALPRAQGHCRRSSAGESERWSIRPGSLGCKYLSRGPAARAGPLLPQQHGQVRALVQAGLAGAGAAAERARRPGRHPRLARRGGGEAADVGRAAGRAAVRRARLLARGVHRGQARADPADVQRGVRARRAASMCCCSLFRLPVSGRVQAAAPCALRCWLLG